jgi:AraC-like DNA-binding protein
MPVPIILVQQPGDRAIEAVAAYAQRETAWRLIAFSDASLSRHPSLLAQASGVIACTRSEATRDRLHCSGLPWLNLRFPNAEGATVTCDYHAIGRLAAMHLAGLGIAGMATLGDDADILTGALTSTKQRLPSLRLRPGASFHGWLNQLDAPWGLLCTSDGIGVDAINAAIAAGKQVPHDLAVCGVNNNPAQALCAAVPLTTIDLNVAGMATVGARLLHNHLTHGGRLPKRTVVPPGELVARRSTDVQHARDPMLAVALRVMEDGFAEGIRLSAVLEACGCSRSTLERLFAARFNLSPGAWLQQRRLREARRMLEAGTSSAATIAAACGLNNASYLARAFKRHYGCPPSQWATRVVKS